MKKSLLYKVLSCLFLTSVHASSFAQTAASATWQPESSTNIPGTVSTNGSIVADPQGGTMEAYTYSTSITAVSDATGYQRTRSTALQPQLPYGNVADPNAYLQYKVSPANGMYLKINSMKVTALGGGTGNCRLVVKYSTNGTDFLTMPQAGEYFLADGTAASYAASEAQPVVLINTGATVNVEAKRTLTFNNINKIIQPGQSFYIRLYPYLIDITLPSSRYFMSRQLVISGVTSDSESVLPLDFHSFTAKASLTNQIKLEWKTTNEQNTKNFVIERGNGDSFSSIGTVEAKNTAGEHAYSFTDIAPLAGTNYYRLLQVDNDGKSTYSATVSAETKGGITLSVFPSPATGSSVTVSHPASAVNALLNVVSLGGAQLAKIVVNAGSTSTNLDISGLASGFYLVKYSNGKEDKSVKFFKQ